MTDRPAPYPADTSAKGWRFEIAMEKVRQSDTWSLTLLRGYEPKALLLWMWSVAWEQIPCGSFPNDEALIAARLELPPKAWQKNRDILMRNWWLASDGRLYHDTVTQRVLAMLDKRANDAKRAAARRARDAESDGTQPLVTPASRVTNGELAPEFDTKHQAPSTRTEGEKKPPAAPWLTVDAITADGVSEEVAKAWLAHRRAKKAKLTALAWAGFKAEAVKAGWELEAAVRKAIARNWVAFESAWVDAKPGGQGAAGGEDEIRAERARNTAEARRLMGFDSTETIDG